MKQEDAAVSTPNRGGRKAADGHRVVVAVAVLDEAESHTCTALTPTEAEIVAAAVVMDRGGGDSKSSGCNSGDRGGGSHGRQK